MSRTKTRTRARADQHTKRITKAVVSQAYERIYAVVRAIPRGRVMTYGQVAEAAGMPRAARLVGTALRVALSATPLPWQRVVGHRRPGWAAVSIKDPVGGALQRKRLASEGVQFSDRDAIDLGWFGWAPMARKEKRTPARRRK